MRNPDLDYQAGLIDLWSVTAIETADDGTITRTHLGECTAPLTVHFLSTHGTTYEVKPSRSAMHFRENDVVGIGETIR